MSTSKDSEASTSSALTDALGERPPWTFVRCEFESLVSESSEEDEEEDRCCDKSEGSNAEVARSLPENRSSSFELRVRREHSVEEATDVVLSMVWSNDRIGAAYYDVVTSELFVLDDTEDDTTYFDRMRALYRQCQPRYVVAISGSSDAFLNALKKLVLAQTLEDEQGCCRVFLKIMPKREYGYERCLHRVRCLQIQTEPEDASAADRLTFLNGTLNFRCRAMIHALGLLLLYVDKHWSSIALVLSGKPPYVSLNHILLQDLVMVDEESYRALKIVQTRYHPSLFKFGSAAAETQGISLFVFLNRCRSLPGVQFLWKTLQHPTRNLRVLNQRFDVVEFFLDPSHQAIAEHLSLFLKHVHRLTSNTFDRYSCLQEKTSDLNKVHKTVSHIISIADVCQSYAARIELFQRIVDGTTDGMRHVKYFIEHVVDFAASRREGKLTVKSNVDPLLDELNRAKASLPELLTLMGEKDMREHLPPAVADCYMIYLPNIGYVLGVKEWNPTPPEDTVLPGLEYKFSLNGVRYYKSPSAKELDGTVGDIVTKVMKRQNEITLKLIRFISKHAGDILRAIRLCAELDTMLAFYAVARDHNYVRPEMLESRIISVTECRHPLQEFLTTFVPNDVHSGGGRSLLKILTGLNCSGKSTYLRQVALVAFMAHIGCYVPARSAKIGLLTHIFTQITTTDSVALSASSFLQDLRQINVALRASTANSLLVIDEFGKATSEVSGLSLLAAVLKSFVDRGERCPHVFIATHIHRVTKLIPNSPLLETQTFEYLVNENESLTFVYRLISGQATRSFAASIARGAGLMESVVRRSIEVFDRLKEGTLPERLSEAQHRDTAKYIVERVAVPTRDLDLDELKSWVRQAICPTLNRK